MELTTEQLRILTTALEHYCQTLEKNRLLFARQPKLLSGMLNLETAAHVLGYRLREELSARAISEDNQADAKTSE